uniref:Uncharacterized protein n=1 Tax=Globodera rostochiensis TaxID=31243 RepID=A0A914I5R8_GLORO
MSPSKKPPTPTKKPCRASSHHSYDVDNVPSLATSSLRAIALSFVRAKLRWRRLEEFRVDCRRAVIGWKFMNESLQFRVLDMLEDVCTELSRWTEKHAQIFPEEENQAVRKAAFKAKAQSLDSAHSLNTCCYRPQQKAALRVCKPAEYLRIFYDCLVWRPTNLKIDDLATATRIIDVHCRNWAQMKFQWACCYAMDELLEDDRLFDKNRRRAFSNKLDSHPVYHLWLCVLDDRREMERLYRPDRLIVDQQLMLVFRFAITHGFLELVHRLWRDLTEGQIETIGFLSWKSVCFSVQHPEMVRFLCKVFCRINLNGMVRLSWDNFYHKVQQTLENDEMPREEQLKRFQKLERLLLNWCPELRRAVLSRENFRVFTDSVYSNKPEPFLLFLDYIEGCDQLLGGARKEVERIWERKLGSEKVRFFRQQLIRRQTANE